MSQSYAYLRQQPAADVSDGRDDVLPMHVAAPLILAISLSLWIGLWKLAVLVVALL